MTRPKIAPSDFVAINAVVAAARQPADVICDRWSLMLVLAAFLGETRFGGLMERTGMASRLLTARLRSLESHGAVLRMPYCMHPPRHEYRLTNMGEGLFEVIMQMARWEQNWPSEGGSAPVAIQHVTCQAPLRPQLRCRACGLAATARDIDLKVSPAQLQHRPPKQTSHRRSIVSSGDGDALRQLLGPSLDIFGDKWGIEILLCAFFRIRRFGDFRLCTGIAANILADRLERLVAAGVLISPRDAADEPGYRLTEKGIDLYGVLVAIEAWADAWLRKRYRSPVRLIHRDCGKTFRPLTTCAACGELVLRSDVRF